MNKDILKMLQSIKIGNFAFLFISLIVFPFNACSVSEKRNSISLVKNPRKHSFHLQIKTGHTDKINSISQSKDGKYALSAGKDAIIRYWEIPTGKLLKVLKGHSAEILSVDISPNGQFGVSGGKDNTIRIWDLTTGRCLHVLKGHSDYVSSVAFSPDNSYILSGSWDRSVLLWETKKGNLIKNLNRIFGGHKDFITKVAFSPDGNNAVSAGFDKEIILHKISNGNILGYFRGHKDLISSVTFSPDGKYLFSGSYDQTIRIWNVQSKKEIKRYNTGAKISSISLSPRGEQIAAGCFDRIVIWDLTTRNLNRDIDSHSDIVTSVSFSPNGNFLLSSSEDKTLKLWNLAKNQEVRNFRDSKQKITSIAYNLDGELLMSGCSDGSIHLWNLSSGKKIKTYKGHQGAISDLLFTGDGGSFLSSSHDKTVRMWNIETGDTIHVFKGHEAEINNLVIDKSGSYAYSGGNDYKICIWDLHTGKQIDSIQNRVSAISSLAILPGSDNLLVGHYDGYLDLIDSNRRFILTEFEGHPDTANFEETLRKYPKGLFLKATNQLWKKPVYALSVSLDSRYAISGSSDNQIRMWDLTDGKELMAFNGHDGQINSLAINSNNDLFLSGGNDKTIRLWDVTTGIELLIFSGHTDRVNKALFDEKNQRVISGSDDGSICLWDAQTGDQVVCLYSFNNGEWIALTPEGYYQSSPEGDTMIHWFFDTEIGAEYYSFEQFKILFKEPHILRERLSGNFIVGTPAPEMAQPPKLSMPDHLSIIKNSDKVYPLNISVASENQIETVRIFNNGIPSLEIRVDAKEKVLQLPVPVPNSVNRITAVAYDLKGFSSNPKYVDILSEVSGLTKPKLHILSVGISRYSNLSFKWQLDFAHSDAKAIIDVLLKQKGVFYNKIEYTLMMNKEATVASIENAFNGLGDIPENDLVMIFMAGHGVRDRNGVFYYLTSEGTLEKPASGGVSWSMIGKYLDTIKARVIIFLDACHSGSIVNETVVPNDELAEEFFTGKRGGVMVFSASKGRQYSMESPDIGGGFGIFSYALTRGLGMNSSEADINGNGYVEFMELVEYVSLYVDKVTMGQQTPWLSRKELFGDLPITTAQ